MKSFETILLQRNDREAIIEAGQLLQTQFPVEHTILFGSKARGDADEYSDIDLVLITTHKLQWEEKKVIHHVLFHLGLQHDVFFSFLCVSREEWNGGIFTELPIYQEIIQDGANVV